MKIFFSWNVDFKNRTTMVYLNIDHPFYSPQSVMLIGKLDLQHTVSKIKYMVE